MAALSPFGTCWSLSVYNTYVSLAFLNPAWEMGVVAQKVTQNSGSTPNSGFFYDAHSCLLSVSIVFAPRTLFQFAPTNCREENTVHIVVAKNNVQTVPMHLVHSVCDELSNSFASRVFLGILGQIAFCRDADTVVNQTLECSCLHFSEFCLLRDLFVELKHQKSS